MFVRTTLATSNASSVGSPSNIKRAKISSPSGDNSNDTALKEGATSPRSAACAYCISFMSCSVLILTLNAMLTEQILDGGFCAASCTKDDGKNLSGAADCMIEKPPF